MFRTDRNNNPTAMTTDVANTLGLVYGQDYVEGDKFPGNSNLKTAKLLGDPIATTTKGLDNAASKGINPFYTAAGKQRWTHTAIPTDQWTKMTPEAKKQVVLNMYKHEGGSGQLANGAITQSLSAPSDFLNLQNYGADTSTKGTSNFYASPYDTSVKAKNAVINTYQNLTEQMKKNVFKTPMINVSNQLQSNQNPQQPLGIQPDGSDIASAYIEPIDAGNQTGTIYTQDNTPPDITLHEDMHSGFVRGTQSDLPEQFAGSPLSQAGFAQNFDQAWQTALQTHQNDSIGIIMQQIDDKLNRDYTNPAMSAQMPAGYQRANERYAFLGQLGGQGIPEELQSFYKDIYK